MLAAPGIEGASSPYSAMGSTNVDRNRRRLVRDERRAPRHADQRRAALHAHDPVTRWAGASSSASSTSLAGDPVHEPAHVRLRSRRARTRSARPRSTSTTAATSPPRRPRSPSLAPPPACRRSTGTAPPRRATTVPPTANASQGDGGADGVGDACEQLPPGNVPPVVGCDRGRAPAVRRGVRQAALPVCPFQSGGFIPLKGVAAIPVGSTRRHAQGRDRDAPPPATATPPPTGGPSGSRPGSAPHVRGQAEARAEGRARKTAISTDVGLLSPPRAEARCATAREGHVVRTISMVVKGSTARSAARARHRAHRDVRHHRPL